MNTEGTKLYRTDLGIYTVIKDIETRRNILCKVEPVDEDKIEKILNKTKTVISEEKPEKVISNIK